MQAIRFWAITSLVLIGAFHVLRFAAAGCQGGECEIYIPMSLLIPVLILVACAVTGLYATAAAWQRARGTHLEWFVALAVCTLLSILGPLVSLAIWRDSPDMFVAMATFLSLLTPAVALSYTLSAR